MIRTLLIANRGEIARRITRTARRMGVRVVAVYSDADANGWHVREADAAYRLGATPASASYLNIGAILAAARATAADAIHPGYGFLSENAEFAAACRDAGITFVGPSPEVMRGLGLKGAAKIVAERAGVPTLPGYHGDDQADRELGGQATRIGFPIVIKASAGGGGRGMRVVHDAGSFADALASARREAMGAFGDDRVILERFLPRPRHVEVQIFGDAHGNVVHLFERDCSLQRRYQKLVEEAPAPGLDEAMRHRLYDAAITLGRAVGYSNAGTVEFLVDGEAFYFLEVNTRLQVEHPVTEEITGLDLVEWQLRVAAGEPLPLAQNRIVATGHAIEVRICAEDPLRDFLPQTGTLRIMTQPAHSVRIDSGFQAGDSIGVAYDSMIAKLIARGADRGEALRLMSEALARTRIVGVTTNVGFLREVIRHPEFAAGEIDTTFFSRHEAVLRIPPPPPTEPQIAAAALAWVLSRSRVGDGGPWRAGRPWRLNTPPTETLRLRWGDTDLAVSLTHASAGFRVRIGDWEQSVRAEMVGHELVVVQGEMRSEFMALVDPSAITLIADGVITAFAFVDPLASAAAAVVADGHVRAPMPGRILKVLAAAGVSVVRGQPLVVLEAMKMEHSVLAPMDGVVERVPLVGDLVEEGAELVVFAAS
ncbi:MAG: ATP-grasp domain-containing protein [Alphaproteobacteria bacterium]|nr:ATP-grasp domain-containing protein [Alphaproteobacteria bacterium]